MDGLQQAAVLEYYLDLRRVTCSSFSGTGPTRVERLVVDEESAKAFGRARWTSDRSPHGGYVANSRKTGLLQRLRARLDGGRRLRKSCTLAAAWRTLIPAAVRAAIAEGRYRRLLIIPDGILAPAAVRGPGCGQRGRAEYLLDHGPAVHMPLQQPVFFICFKREKESSEPGRERCSTVGNPEYRDQPPAAVDWSARQPRRRSSSLLATSPP